MNITQSDAFQCNMYMTIPDTYNKDDQSWIGKLESIPCSDLYACRVNECKMVKVKFNQYTLDRYCFQVITNKHEDVTYPFELQMLYVKVIMGCLCVTGILHICVFGLKKMIEYFDKKEYSNLKKLESASSSNTSL